VSSITLHEGFARLASFLPKTDLKGTTDVCQPRTAQKCRSVTHLRPTTKTDHQREKMSKPRSTYAVRRVSSAFSTYRNGCESDWQH
jgi:hypothetical protein